jgi:uncharacterized membrane protein
MCCMMMHAMDHSMHGEHEAQGASSRDETLLQILKRRFALGEITQEQYEAMRSVLGIRETASAAEHAHH